MTAPVYTDKHEVFGMTKEQIKEAAHDYRNARLQSPDEMLVKTLANAALELWAGRDQARETAALQDAAIHKQVIHTHAMEKCVRVLRWFANANEENGTVLCFYCSAPWAEGHADPCGVVDAKKVLADLDKTK